MYCFIHIGKCGGSSIRKSFKQHGIKHKSVHLGRPKFNKNHKYIFWIRNPIKRFVSAFNYSYLIINFNTDNKTKYTLDNCPAPVHIRRKEKNKIAFHSTPLYSKLINFFKTPNALAESLTCNNKIIKTNALKLMTFRVEHIYKGIGWYLYNGDFVKKYNNNIFFVGTIEDINNDISMLNKKLESNIIVPKIRVTKKYGSRPTDLSDKAVKNIIDFYSNTDYKALKILKEKEWISKETLDSYYLY